MRLRNNGKGRLQLPLLAAAFLLTLMGVGLVSPAPAYANCSGPTGVAGQQLYNSSEHVMQYCDGTNWIPMWGSDGSAGGGGSSPLPSITPCTISSGQMSLLNSISNATSLANAYGLSIYGNTAFVGGDGSTRFTAIDISNPSSMSIISSLTAGYNAVTIASSADGSKAFTVGATGDRLMAINTSNPSSMSVLGSMGVAVADYAYGVVVNPNNENYVYTSSSDDDEIDVVNVSNPASMSRVGGYGPDATNLDRPRDIVISGNYLFAVAETADRITAFNISTPTTATFVSSLSSPANIDGPIGLAIKGDYLFVASLTNGRLTAVNISNPASMTVAGSVSVPAAHYVTIAGDYAFVSSYPDNKIRAVDISNPASMVVKDTFTLPGTRSNRLAVSGSTLFVTDDVANSLYSIDLGCTPGQPAFEFGSLIEKTCPAGYTYNENLASCYKTNSAAAYSTASGVCAGSGGYLLKPDSYTEESYARSLIGDQWIGLTDSVSEGTWVWDNGDPFIRANWNGGEPNNSGNEDCGILRSAANNWNDGQCGTSLPYICEANPVFTDVTCPAGYKFHPKAMKCIKFFTSQTTWTNANNACIADAAQLPVIHNSAKQNALASMIDRVDLWVGYTDQVTEGEFLWVDGTKSGANDYNNWSSGEPNNTSNEDYTNLNNDSTWNDSSAGTNNRYLCEKDPEEVCNPENHNVKAAKTGPGTSGTLSGYTVPDVQSRMLIVSVAQETTGAFKNITSVTFGGQPLTEAISGQVNAGTGYNNAAIYYMIDPPATTGNIVANFDSSASAISIAATTVNCLAQEAPEVTTSQVDTTTTTTTGATYKTSITTLSDVGFIYDSLILGLDGLTPYTTESNQIEVSSEYNTTSPDLSLYMSTRLVDYAGTYDMGWNARMSRKLHLLAAFKTNMFGGAVGDNMGSHSAGTNLNMSGYKITNAAAPTASAEAATKAYVDGLTGASNETDPQVGNISTPNNYCRSDGTKIICDIAPSAAAGPPLKVAVVAEQQPANTDPVTPVTGSWQTRTLNTIQGDSIGVSLSSNEITLPTGTYYVEATIPFKMVDNVAVRLVDSADTLLVPGNQTYCDSDVNNANVSCITHIRGTFSLASSTAVKMQYYIQSDTDAYFGTMGDATGAGPEQYAIMSITELP